MDSVFMETKWVRISAGILSKKIALNKNPGLEESTSAGM